MQLRRSRATASAQDCAALVDQGVTTVQTPRSGRHSSSPRLHTVGIDSRSAVGTIRASSATVRIGMPLGLTATCTGPLARALVAATVRILRRATCRTAGTMTVTGPARAGGSPGSTPKPPALSLQAVDPDEQAARRPGGALQRHRPRVTIALKRTGASPRHGMRLVRQRWPMTLGGPPSALPPLIGPTQRQSALPRGLLHTGTRRTTSPLSGAAPRGPKVTSDQAWAAGSVCLASRRKRRLASHGGRHGQASLQWKLLQGCRSVLGSQIPSSHPAERDSRSR